MYYFPLQPLNNRLFVSAPRMDLVCFICSLSLLFYFMLPMQQEYELKSAIILFIMLTVPIGCFCLAVLQPANVGSRVSTKLFSIVL